MPFTIPEDPFTRDLGRSLEGATRDIAAGYIKKQEQDKETERNYQFMLSLGFPEEEARKSADLSSQQIALAGKQKGKRKQLDQYANYLLKTLDIDPESPKGKVISEADDIETLNKIGAFEMKRKQEASPFQLSKESRLKKDDMSKYYKRITDDIIKNPRSYGLSKEQSDKALGELKQEEFKNRKRIEKGKKPKRDAMERYFALFTKKEEKETVGFWDQIGRSLGFSSDEAPQEQQQFPEQQQQAPQEEAPQEQEKVSFDKSNPEHLAVKEAALIIAKKQSDDPEEQKRIATKILKERFK